MNYKYILGAIFLAALGVVGVYFLLQQSVSSVSTDVAPTQVMEATSSVVDVVQDVTKPGSTNPIQTAIPSTSVLPTAPQTRVLSMAEVQAHSSEASCWTAISGKVYDVSAFIKKHPGGDRNILRICGIDGTRLFTGQHGGQGKPERTLAEFYIGILE